MGCDIHARAEVRKNGAWVAVGAVFPHDDFDAEYTGDSHGVEPFSNRNYEVFEVLAGVRPRRGVTPLQVGRGVPQDVSDEVRDMIESWEPDGHSHGWLTLGELRGADIDSEQFKEHLEVLKSLGGDDDVRVVFFFDN